MLPSGQAGAKGPQVCFSEDLPRPGPGLPAPPRQLQFRFQWGWRQYKTSSVLEALCCTPPIWTAQWYRVLVASGPLEQVPKLFQVQRQLG